MADARGNSISLRRTAFRVHRSHIFKDGSRLHSPSQRASRLGQLSSRCPTQLLIESIGSFYRRTNGSLTAERQGQVLSVCRLDVVRMDGIYQFQIQVQDRHIDLQRVIGPSRPAARPARSTGARCIIATQAQISRSDTSRFRDRRIRTIPGVALVLQHPAFLEELLGST